MRTLTQGIVIKMGDNAAEDGDMIEVPVAMETEETPITDMTTRDPELVKDN